MSRTTPVQSKIKSALQPGKFTWKTVQDYSLVLVGALIQALAMRLFLVPGQLVSGGISGAAQIVNHFVDFPIGVMVLLGNAPLFILGWRYLGGKRFALRTAIAVGAFSLFTDLLTLVIPAAGMTQDNVLNTVFGAILYGAGLGLVYRGQGTSGGSDILGRILNRRFGISISMAYMITDSIVVLAGGFAFSWEKALYGLGVIYISGLAAEAVSEGQSVYRTAIIITSAHQQVMKEIMTELERGVTILSGTGGYTGEARPVLYCVITRSEVNQVKELVKAVDPQALVVIGSAHEVLGEGFRELK
jgi:uncharacterized membrane-anchored protein YitT (DUF2179 family)